MSTNSSEEAGPPPVSLTPTSLPFPVVGIGGSAGALRALMSFFEHMPSGSGMSFVVVMHLSPTHESTADQILRSVTRMPVLQVTGRTHIERDHVYVIPPNKHLVMQDGVLELTPFQRKDGRSTSIDYFFRTLASAHRDHAIAIVLSGNGSDGSVGLKNVKEHGGLTLVQAPMEAEYDAMPRSAIGTGIVDFTMPVAQMPERLLQLWQNIQQIRIPDLGDGERDAKGGAEGGPRGAPRDAPGDALDHGPRLAPSVAANHGAALGEILQSLQQRTGHDFAQYKRATVMRRLERRLQVNELPDLPSYARYLREHADETRALLKDMLISVTNFFRDREAFDALERAGIPELFAGKTHMDEVRVWVAGCATGEEAYSVAILLAEYAGEQGAPPAFQVFATDIDEDAIAVARAGIYPDAIVADVSPTRLRRYFVKEAGGYRLQKSIRERVMFATHNLLRDPPFSRLDLVACRNLLIYLDRDAQARVLNVFHFALRAGGLLFLGTSESVDEAGTAFVPVDKAHRLFRGQPSGRTVPTLLMRPAVLTARSGNPGGAAMTAGMRQDGGSGALHLNLLEHYAPPSVVINDLYEVIHLSQKAGGFLQFSAGEPSLNLVKVVQPELRTELRAGLFQSLQTMESVKLSIGLRRGDTPVHVEITIHPVPDGTSGRTFALVTFDEREDGTLSPQPQPQALAHGGPVQKQLEADLASTRDQLRDTIEQYETQNEELKAGNEELQAINEELRSTTEELETSKEELQSMNEELTTVNHELKSKIDEATSINNDLQNFIASTEIAVLFVDRGMRLLRFTPPARELFNVIAGDVGRPLLDVTNRMEYPELERDLAAVLDSLRVVEREVRRTDGRWYFVRLLPYRTSDDRIDGVVVTLVDISTRRQAEERLRNSEEWMRFVVDSVQDYAILTLDVDGRVDSWNTGAERVFGYREEEIVGKPGEIIFTPEDRAIGAPADEMRRAREDGHASDERWHLRKDGTRFYCSGMMTTLNDGRLHGYVKVARDLTDQKLLSSERERLLAQERAARAEVEDLIKQKDQFLAMLSHELRNPLNLILMQSQLLLRTNPFKDAKSRRTAEIIHQTAATQARLVDDLLDVSRVMTGKLAIQQQLVPLPFIVGDSIGAVARDAEQKKVNLDVNLTPEPLIVEADPVRLRQIAWNLLSNAIKFTPEGGSIWVSLTREGNDARLQIRDTGQGIDAATLPHVFELFRQSESNLTRHQGGMGIGLALVKQLVELHDGRIDVASEGRDQGATFTVWLPTYVVPPPALPPAAEARPPSAVAEPVAVPSASGRLGGLRILIVDDGVDAVEAMHELLEMEGAVVTSAVSGPAALESCRDEPFDVIVSDLAMPGMDGMTLLREIRRIPQNAGVPAIACSGFNRRQDVEKSLAAGFVAHLSKPIGVADLVDAILRAAATARG